MARAPADLGLGAVERAPAHSGGSLTLVGTGIAAGAHLTPEARAELAAADAVLYLGAEPIADSWLARLNPNSRALGAAYEEGVSRDQIYGRMVEEILAPVREGRRVCVAFYGHPGFLVRPGHGAVARARDEGFPARMLPAVSALDCLIADLGIDPGDGLQAYEATEFLVHGRRPDPTAPLVLWQLSVVGADRWSPAPDVSRLGVLVDALADAYGLEHEVVLYEASPYVVAGAQVESLPIGRLAEAEITPMASLYVPPARPPAVQPDAVRRLGFDA